MKILKNPWIILLSAVGGVLFGIYASKDLVLLLSPIGTMYISLLEMSIIPILFSAIVSSVARLVRSPNVGSFFFKYVTYSVVFLAAASILAAGVGLIAQPGNLNAEQQGAIGKIIEASEFETDLAMSLSDTSVSNSAGESWLFRFLNLLVPSNIFNSLAQARTLELVFFCIFFGIAIALVPQKRSDLLVSFMSSTFEAFQRIVDWAMYPLPIGLFVLVAKQVKDTGLNSLIASLRFLLAFYGVGVVVIVLTIIIISIHTKKNIFSTIRIFLQAIIVSFSTRNSVATIPLGIEALKKLNYDPIITRLVVPLSITICRFGNVIYFSLAAVYASQVYDLSFTFVSFVLVVFGAVIAGTATAGSTGFATLGMISILLVDLLGLPSEAILIVFYSIDPIVDPMRTLLIVQPNLLLAILTSPKQSNSGVSPKRDNGDVASSKQVIQDFDKMASEVTL